jgi:hypothetical protein
MEQANTNLVCRSGRSGRPQSPFRVVNSFAFIWRNDTRELEHSTTTRAVSMTGALRAVHCQVARSDGSEMDPTSNVLERLADGPGTTSTPARGSFLTTRVAVSPLGSDSDRQDVG